MLDASPLLTPAATGPVDSSSSEWIAHAWRLRLTQQIEDCRMAVAGLRMSLRIPAGFPRTVDTGSVLSGAGQPTLCLQTLLLIASLQRADGQRRASLQLLTEIFEAVRQLHMPIPFELPFQKGLGFFAVADYASALDAFLSARALASTPVEELLACGNAVFCLDFLGLPFMQTLAEAKTLLTQLQPDSASPILSQMAASLKTLQAFENFRAGHLAEFFEKTGAKNEAPQITYLRSWMAGLPYHTWHDENLSASLEQLSIQNPHFFKKSYRVRTLQGLLHPDDSHDLNESEFCDRVYLWTWWWLKDSSRFPLQKIVILLKQVNLGEIAHRLSMDDYQKLSNALRWLGLFDSAVYHKLESAVQLARPHRGREHELFQFEADVQNFLLARRDGRELEANDYLLQLRAHPLAIGKGLSLLELADGPRSDRVSPLDRLNLTIQKLLPSKDETPSMETYLEVDLRTFSVTHLPTGKAQVSEPLARALDVLNRHGQIACADFLASCFGIEGYEPLSHDAKIFNLLARIRQLLPDSLRVGVKCGRVFAIGSWKDILVHRAADESLNVRSQSEWKSFLSATPAKVALTDQRKNQSHILLKKLAGQNEFSRDEIEHLTGVSRSTANRLITAWLKRGWVTRRGQARRTRYVLVDSFQTPPPKGYNS